MTESMAAGTSVQTGLSGFGKETAQVKMLEESNTAAGQGGTKPGLIEVKESYKPLPGQLRYKTPEAEAKKVKLYESKAQIKELQDTIKSSPVKHFLPLIMKSGRFRGEIKTLTKKQYRQLMRKEPLPAILDKSGRIPWHYAFDELAAEAGYKSDEDFKEAIEKLSDQVKELRQLKSGKAILKSDIVKAETTLPKAETIKLNSMEPPVFDKRENTRGEVTEIGNIEVKSRRNPSFWQTEIDDKTTEKQPDQAYRIRYKNQADKLTHAAIRDAQDRMTVRPPRITPRMPRITPKMPKLR